MDKEQAAAAHANRLIHETSPYLLQHAHNPVDWYAWGPEAFDRARREDKPVFLSIGYSTCHWCHVMERESFEDEEVARILKEHFIAIKVDREERPDIDATYMKAVQMMTGSGGWPLSVFLTPEGKPFYGGTYFPPASAYGRPSFKQVLLALAQAWREQRRDLLASAQKLTDLIERPVADDAQEPLTPEVLTTACETLARQFDPVHGGFGAAPKFPQPSTLMLLLHYWHRIGEPRALEMVETTLQAMSRGGLHDHLGGGFHRYSTDGRWLVPHFEKMLYDQALLSRVYVQAYQITKKETYAATARDILDYVLRDMTDAQGGFYAAEDADSEGREGTFYVWKPGEIGRVLGEEKARIFRRFYGVTDEGNFEEGENVLHAAMSPEELAGEVGKTAAEVETILAEARRRLLERRNHRPRPYKDDKIITAWNGLMISSMACGGAVLAEPKYVEAASKAADFVLGSLHTEGRLRRYFRTGRAVEKAFLDDYAFMILGLMDLYEASFEPRFLGRAGDLAGRMIELFADDADGGFFTTGTDAERLLARDKPGYDGAVPGGNSIAALVLLRLGKTLMEDDFRRQGERTLRRFSGPMSESPMNLTAMLLALDYHLGPTQEIVIAADAQDRSQALVAEVRRHFLPNATVLFRPGGPDGAAITGLVPFIESLTPLQGRATAYVCEDYACRQPVTTERSLRNILAEFSQTH
ncbi:MAG: thioredoxin domain-containing protein [Sedimentisphaerales bacterium]|nr:thioredoxin domain-containing protein [Sedimentisphaerales bacterium]